MEIIILIAGIIILLDGITYFVAFRDSAFRRWLSERRDRPWMRIWPPARWALDSEKARLATGIIQTLLGIFLVSLYCLQG